MGPARLAASLATLCVALGSAWTAAALTPPQRDALAGRVDHPALVEDRRLFDGAQFVDGVPFVEVHAYYLAYVGQLNSAITSWNALSQDDLDDDEVRPVRTMLRAKLAWGRAMAAAYPAPRAAYLERVARERATAAQAAADAAARTAAADALCREFRVEVMTPGRMRAMMRLLDRDELVDAGPPAALTEIRESAAAVEEACSRGKYRDVGKGGCDWLARPAGRAQWDPEAWCAVAPRWQELLLAQVRSGIAAEMEAYQRRPLVRSALAADESLAALARCVPDADGWTDVDRYDACQLTDRQRTTLLERYAQRFVEIGEEPDLDETILTPMIDGFAEARRMIDEAAATWRAPEARGADYSVKFAKRQLARRVRRARWKDGYLAATTWQVERDAGGAPLRRTRPGYVLYQVRGEPWCQLRAYTVTEEHVGDGAYRKARRVEFGAQRFQACGDGSDRARSGR